MAKRVNAQPVPAAVPGAAGFELLSDFGREQIAMCMDGSAAVFRGFQAMRTIQQQAASEATARHEAAARRLRQAAGADVITIGFELVQADLLCASRYWQDLAGAALEMQTEVASCTCHLFDAPTALQGVSAIDTLDLIPGLSNVFPLRARSATEQQSESAA